MLTAVVDGDVVFATRGDAAVGRAAVTAAPDGTRWAGVSAVRVADGQRRQGHARALCSALMAWAAEQGAHRCYVQVLVDNAPAIALYEQLGFTTQHRRALHRRSVACSHAAGHLERELDPGPRRPRHRLAGTRRRRRAGHAGDQVRRRPVPHHAVRRPRIRRRALRLQPVERRGDRIAGRYRRRRRSASTGSRRGATSRTSRPRPRHARSAPRATACGCGACTYPTAARWIPRTTPTSWNGLPRCGIRRSAGLPTTRRRRSR